MTDGTNGTLVIVGRVSAGNIILDGLFQVRLTNYCNNSYAAMSNMPFKLFRVSDNVEITNSGVTHTSNQYRNGYWYTDSNGGYNFELPGGNYEIRLKAAEIQITTQNNANGQTTLSIGNIQSREQRFGCSSQACVRHRLENPLRNTPLYKQISAVAMCISLTPDALINAQSDSSLIKHLQELLNWVGFFGTYTQRNSGSSLNGTYGNSTRSGVTEFQQILNANTNYPQDLPPRRSDGLVDGITVLAMAAAYRNQSRRRSAGDPQKVLIKILDSQNQQKIFREDAGWNFHQFIEEVECNGGIIDLASGGYVALDATRPLRQGTSLTSLHNTGRAGDHNTNAGMQNPQNDRYVIVRDGNNDPPRWIVWCRCDRQDGSQGQNQQLNGWRWAHGNGGSTRAANGFFVNITNIAQNHGIDRISARGTWANSYMATEWWHFQYEQGLQNSSWGQEMNVIGYTNNDLRNYLNQVLNNVNQALAGTQIVQGQKGQAELQNLQTRLQNDSPNYTNILNSRPW
jgi:peptidoglycan hydrolase-like protein with peptidoglycan-binding domain